MGICLLISQGLPFFFIKPGLLQIALRCYVAVFTIIFIFSELEVSCFTRHFVALDSWAYRGILQSFIGLIGIEESVTLYFIDKGNTDVLGYEIFAAAFITVSSNMM